MMATGVPQRAHCRIPKISLKSAKPSCGSCYGPGVSEPCVQAIVLIVLSSITRRVIIMIIVVKMVSNNRKDSAKLEPSTLL